MLAVPSRDHLVSEHWAWEHKRHRIDTERIKLIDLTLVKVATSLVNGTKLGVLAVAVT